MPLSVIPGTLAFENMKANPYGSWPSRGEPGNRVEPMAKPHFDPSFRLMNGEAIFTIGSCFARNVEAQLELLGFDVPMRRLKVVEGDVPDGEDNPNIFNNYAAPSIFNELQWALDPANPFDPDVGLVEIARNKFVDLHLSRFLKPVPRAEAIARRNRIKAGMAEVTRCRVVVITLGLVEVWYDLIACRYLNISPPKTAVRNEPDRFSVHILSYEEVKHYLKGAIDLLQRFGRDDLRMILTVSPVPLAVTFNGQDVMVANAYSKAALRAVAQEIVMGEPSADYFPSYESVVLSDRGLAWQDDLRHVTKEMISLNVSRMIAKYTGARDADALCEMAKKLERGRLWSDAAGCYRDALDQEPTRVEAAMGLARSLAWQGLKDEALTVLSKIRDESNQALTTKLFVVRKCGQAQDYRKLIQGLPTRIDLLLYREIIAGLFELGDLDECERICRSMEASIRRPALAYEYLGRIAMERANFSEAEKYFNRNIECSAGSNTIFVLLGDALVKQGKNAQGEDAYRRALKITPNMQKAKDRLANIFSVSDRL